MSNPLAVARIDGAAEPFLRGVGRIVAVFGDRTQDSGNVSYGVEVDGERLFVKTAGSPSAPVRAGGLAHSDRVELLRGAVRFAHTFDHPTLARLRHIVESPEGPLLVYSWAPGELLGCGRERRQDPRSAYRRFRALPPQTICAVLDQIIDLHVLVAAAGWAAVDFYDGCLLYEFATAELTIIDLDMYRPCPIRNDRGRMFGSARFMAPEEFELGAVIDERTMVHTLGRTVLVLLGDAAREQAAFRGTAAQFRVAHAATEPGAADRVPSVAAFARAWVEAAG